MNKVNRKNLILLLYAWGILLPLALWLLVPVIGWKGMLGLFFWQYGDMVIRYVHRRTT